MGSSHSTPASITPELQEIAHRIPRSDQKQLGAACHSSSITPVSILDFAPELIQEIAYRIPRSDQKKLRAACKTLSLAISPLFFSSVTLNIDQPKLDACLPFVEALAEGETPWSKFGRTLRMSLWGPSPYPQFDRHRKLDEEKLELVNSQLKQLLPVALNSLKNVHTVIWKFDRTASDLKWTAQVMVDFISSLTQLDDFRFDGPKLDCALDGLSGLRKLGLGSRWDSLTGVIDSMSRAISNSPNLSSLRLAGGGSDDSHFSQLVRGLSTIRPLNLTELRLNHCLLNVDSTAILHLKSLKTFHFDGNSSSSNTIALEAQASVRRMWDGFRLEGIHLAEVGTNVLDDALLNYLGSYSGVARLVFVEAGADCEQETNRLADHFFETILPKHEKSLVELTCTSKYQGRWCFGPHNMSVLWELRKLECLQMSVSYEQDPAGRMVHLLLHLIEELPVTVAAILPEASSFWGCGKAMAGDRRGKAYRIATVVREFRSPVASSALILAGDNYFKKKLGAQSYHEEERVDVDWPYSYERQLKNDSWI